MTWTYIAIGLIWLLGAILLGLLIGAVAGKRTPKPPTKGA